MACFLQTKASVLKLVMPSYIKLPSDMLYLYRPKWEGGQYDGDEKHRLDVLRLAMELGADYIDVEFQVLLLHAYITLESYISIY